MRAVLFFAFAAMLAGLISCKPLDPNDPGVLVPRTVNEDASLPSIFVNGTQLHAETSGNPADPMIVVLHGGPGGDYRSLLNLSRFSADGFFVVFYDQRGSGLSKRHPKEIYTTQLFIDDLDGVIRHYRQPGQKVFLMGQSWGAMLATAYVNAHPTDVSGMVLMEPGGLTWQDTEAYLKRWKSPEVFDEASNDAVYLSQILTGSDHNILDYKAGIQSAGAFAPGNKLGISGPVPFWRVGAVCNTAAFTYVRDHPFDFTSNLHQFTTPVLFLYSELNQAYGRAYADHVSSAYPTVQLAEISGCGHEIPCFGWEQLYPIARTYLTSLK
jgi:proline iminopeptidase